MKFGKRIVLIDSLIIALLTAVIVIAAAVAGTTVLRDNIRNTLIDTVTSRAAIISEAKGVVPDNFDYNVGGVYLSVYLSDGTLKNGSFPGPLELPIRKGIVSRAAIEGAQYYVYDFAITLEGRGDIYLRGIVAASYDVWFIAMVSVAVLAGALAAAGIALNLLSVRRAVSPIEKMRREVNEITASKDLTKRISKVDSDRELGELADDYNYMLESLEAMFQNHERFTSDVAHELRTPLTVILSESEYALTETDSMSEKNASLATISRQSRRLKAITDSLLEFTRFANKRSIALRPTDLSAVTAELLGDYPFTRGICCKSDIAEGIVVSADVTLYERVLQNLLDNAVKYGREGGKVEVTLRREGERAVLTVSDDGVGMSEETKKHAFDRFYREERARSEKDGLGLGLCLVKEIVRLFGGEIAISSALGKGTSVAVTLDMVPSENVCPPPAPFAEG